MIEILSPGLLTTVQDTGRYGWQKYGVPVSGAMDGWSLAVANLLAGNAPAMAFYQKQGFRFDGTSKTETLVEPVVEQRWVCTL